MLKRLTTLALTCGALYLLGFGVFLYQLPQQNGIQSLSDEDAIVVFTGGTGRIYTAKRLMRKQDLPMLISGVNERVHPRQVLGDSATHYASDITYDYESPSTRGNVSMTHTWAEERGFKKILLITSYYHIPRSLLLFQQSGFTAEISIYPVFPKTVSIFFLLREYTKFLLTYSRIL